MLGYLNKIEEEAVLKLKNSLVNKLGDNIKQIILYGSKARGDFHKDSDIDILVLISSDNIEFKDTIDDVTSDIGIEYLLPLSVHIRTIQHFNEQTRNSINHYIQNVNKEGIKLWN